jgi:single-strand DNA-binding protein
MPTVNLAVLAGTLAKAAEPRLLPDGSTVWELDIAIRPEGRAASTVPVSWPAPPGGPDPASWGPGDGLVVVGAVRRRFYRAGGATVSRTDVLAEAVVPSRQHKRVPALLADALAPLCSVGPAARSPRGDRLRGHG